MNGPWPQEGDMFRPSAHLPILLSGALLGLLCGPLSAQAGQEPPTNRHGAFVTLGMGYGTVGCSGCDSEGGIAPHFEVGGWLSSTVQLGFGLHTWKYEDGAFGTAGPVLTAYFGKTSPFYVSALTGLAAGVGFDTYFGFGAAATL